MNYHEELTEEDFDECFEEFDEDGNGTIDKAEMIEFIKKVAGIGKKNKKPEVERFEEQP